MHITKPEDFAYDANTKKFKYSKDLAKQNDAKNGLDKSGSYGGKALNFVTNFIPEKQLISGAIKVAGAVGKKVLPGIIL